MTRKSESTDENYFVCIKKIDVTLFGLNAAAILSVIKAGDKWRIETNYRNKKANDIAKLHGDARWLPENVSLRFTIQDFIERTFGICGRNGVMEALKKLEAFDVIKPYANPNKKYTSDKGRYFHFNQPVYDKLVSLLKEGISPETILAQQSTCLPDPLPSAESEEEAPVIIDLPNLNDAPFKNKQEQEDSGLKLNAPRLNLNPPRLKLDLHIMNSNNNYKNIITQSINTKENSDQPSVNTGSDFPHNDELQLIVTALAAKGMPAKRFYADAITELGCLQQAGATVEIISTAYDLAVQATQNGDFGVPYLAKVVYDLLAKAKQSKPCSKSPPRPKDKFSDLVYESDTRNALSWK